MNHRWVLLLWYRIICNQWKQFSILNVSIVVSFGQDVSMPLIGGCEQVKFFYQDGNFDSSYVLKDIDSDVMDDGCVDGCVYLK